MGSHWLWFPLYTQGTTHPLFPGSWVTRIVCCSSWHSAYVRGTKLAASCLIENDTASALWHGCLFLTPRPAKNSQGFHWNCLWKTEPGFSSGGAQSWMLLLLMGKTALLHDTLLQGLPVRPHINPASTTGFNYMDTLHSAPCGVLCTGDAQWIQLSNEQLSQRTSLVSAN